MQRTAFALSRPLGLLVVLLLLSMIFLVSFSSVQPPIYAEENAPDALGSISGVVRNEAGDPLAGMQLALYTSNYPNSWPLMAVTTDNNGRYRFLALPARVYHIGVTDPNGVYAKTFYANQFDAWAATDILVNGTAMTGIDLTLAAGGEITGELQTAAGSTVLHQSLTLYQKIASFRVLNGQVSEWWPVEEQILDTPQSAFQFRGLAAGRYHLCASSDDNFHYWQECYDNVTDLMDSHIFTITAGTVISNVVLVLGDGANRGVIQGRVTSAQAEPLANIGVYAIPFNAVAYDALPFMFGTLSATPVASSARQPAAGLAAVITPTPAPPLDLPSLTYAYYTTTASDGSYTVNNLFNGNYQIYFHDRAGRYRYEYYNDVTYRSNAAAIQVTQQTTVTDINAALDLGSHLTGTITLYGQPAPSTKVTLYKQEHDQWIIAATATSDLWSGDYDIGGLPAGVYHLQAEMTIKYADFVSFSWYAFYGGTEWTTATEIKLAAAEIRPNLDINFAQGLRFDGAISGRVTAHGAPQAGVVVSLFTRPHGCCNPLLLQPPFTSATTDQDGRYQIAGLTDGIYYVRYEDPSGQHAALFYPNQPTLDFDQPVVTNDTEPVTAIDAELPPAGMVQGHIRSLAGETLLANTMLAILTNPQQMAPGQTSDYQTSFVYRTAPVNADGTFSLPGLYPGTYHICATVKTSFQNGYYGLDCYGSFNDQPLFTSGKAITVTAGQTVTDIDLLWGPDYKQYLPVVAR